MTANYDYWKTALAGTFGPVHDGECGLGFWRKRVSRGGAFVPVATWAQDGKVIALVDGKEADPAEVWTYICRYPVTEAAYRQRVDSGRWPDEDAAVADSLAHSPENEPKDDATLLRDQIVSALAGVGDYSKVADDEAAAKAQSLRSRLLELSGSADKKREALVRPHLDAQKAVNDLWQPLVKTAKAGADSLKAAISAFETEQKRKRDAEEAERQRLARQAAQEAEKARLAAEAAGQPAPEPPPPAPTPEPVPAPQTQVRGAYGRAASKKIVKKARVVDFAAATAAMVTHPELRALVEKLAQRAVDAGVMVPGVEFEEIVDVR